MKIKINYWEQLDCIRANRVLKIFAASLIWFCAKDCWLIVHHVPEKGRELFRHEDMRVRKSSCAKLVFLLLLGLFLLLRLPQQGEQSGHAIGVCISFNFHKVCFPWFCSLWSLREGLGLCLDQHYAMFDPTYYRLQKKLQLCIFSLILRRGGRPLVVDAKWLQRKKRILQMRSERNTFFKV